MHYIIYETTNLINGKLYRGCHQTETLDDGYLGSGGAFTNAVKKYGKENFIRTVLLHCNSLDDMIQKESQYVDEQWVNDRNNYNLQTGGLSYGIPCTESKKKISDSLRGRRHTQESKDKMSLNSNRKYNTATHNSKISKSMQKDHTIYTFVSSVDDKIFTGTKYEFTEQYNFKRKDLSTLINKTYKTCKGWAVE